MKRLALLSLVAVFAFSFGCKKKEEAAKKPDTKTPDTKTPDTKTPDTKTPDTKTPDAKPAMGGYTMSAMADLKWTPVDAKNPKSPQVSAVHGNPMTDGPSAFFLKVPADSGPPIHAHTASYSAVVLSGGVKHWLPEEKDSKPLAPQSYWHQPAGQAHGDRCDGKEDCILFITMDGKFDFLPMPDAKKAEPNEAYKMVKAGDFKWGPMNPDAKDGPKLAILDGNPETGPVTMVGKFPKGNDMGLHSHTSDYHAVYLAGSGTHWLEDGTDKDKTLVMGDYWFQPGGQVHGDKCGDDAECDVLIVMPKGMDFIPAKAAGDMPAKK